MEDIERVISRVREKTEQAINAFIRKFGEEHVEHVKAACAAVAPVLGPEYMEPTIEASVSESDATEIKISVSLPPALLMAAVGLGLICPECKSIRTEDVDPDDMEAYQQLADAPSNYRRCLECGNYIRTIKPAQ